MYAYWAPGGANPKHAKPIEIVNNPMAMLRLTTNTNVATTDRQVQIVATPLAVPVQLKVTESQLLQEQR